MVVRCTANSLNLRCRVSDPMKLQTASCCGQGVSGTADKPVKIGIAANHNDHTPAFKLHSDIEQRFELFKLSPILWWCRVHKPGG